MSASSRRAWVLLLATLVATGCDREASTLARIRRTGILSIGTDASYPPFEQVVGGRFEGFDMDLGRTIAADLGVKAQFVNTAFDGIFPALLAGKFDLVLSAVTITDDRRRRLAFSTPYHTAGQLVAVRADAPDVRGLDDLDGRPAGIQLNTTAAAVLARHPAIPVRQYPTLDLALQDLANGNVDAVVGDAPTLRWLLTRGFPGLRTVGGPLTTERYGVAMRPGDDDLRQAVDTTLARLAADGGLAALEARWLGPAPSTASTPTPWRRTVGVLARGLALTVGLTVIALLLGLPGGVLVALARRAPVRPVAWLARGYVDLIRGTPLLVQIIFVYYALPTLIGVNLPPFSAAVLALAANSAAYAAEIVRAGIESIDPGQMEAARALGMTPATAMRWVILPQAVRRVLPPLTNEGIALLKDSSLVSVIGMAELTRAGQEQAGQLAAPLVVWPLVALGYLAVTLPLGRLAAALERRWVVHH